MVSVALAAPVTVGAKAKVSAQDEPAATLVQVPVFVNAAALVPDITLLLIVRVAEPEFEIVRVRPALVVPTN